VAGLALSMFCGSKMSLQFCIMASRSPLAKVNVLLSSFEMIKKVIVYKIMIASTHAWFAMTYTK
jgi:hypothetical protein